MYIAVYRYSSAFRTVSINISTTFPHAIEDSTLPRVRVRSSSKGLLTFEQYIGYLDQHTLFFPIYRYNSAFRTVSNIVSTTFLHAIESAIVHRVQIRSTSKDLHSPKFSSESTLLSFVAVLSRHSNH